MLLSLLLLAQLSQLVSAHFVIQYPESRGFNEEKEPQWPCGGFNKVSPTRAEFPVSGGPIQIRSTHTQELLEVLVAVGNEPGGSFNTVVVPTFMKMAPGLTCFGDVTLPSSLNVTEGTNATFQVISGADDGALYGCIDVTLTSETLSQKEFSQHCSNTTQMEVMPLKNPSINANETSLSNVEVASSSSSSSADESSADKSSAAGSTGRELLTSGLLAGITLATALLSGSF